MIKEISTKTFQKSIVLVAVILFLATSNAVFAKNYYVSNLGLNTNAGTLELPFKTIDYAVKYSGLAAGDTIFIRGGTYPERVKMSKSGTANGRITVINYPGEIPVIDGTGINIPSNEFAMFELRASYVTIDGLSVKNAVIFGGVKRDDGIWANRGGSQCIRVLGPNVQQVTIRNCKVTNCLSSGIAVWGYSGKNNFTGATDILIENNVNNYTWI